MKEHFDWDAETSTATYTYTVDNKTFVGTAKCCPEDADMCSQKTGSEIARRRAAIKYFKYEKQKVNDVLDEITKHLWNPIQQSKRFDAESYLGKELKDYVESLEATKEYFVNIIHNCEVELEIYLKEKDIFYKQIRKIRKDKNKETAGQN